MSEETILIVEDEEDIRELISYNLERVGYQTLSAETGEDGLKKARDHSPDLPLFPDEYCPVQPGLNILPSLHRQILSYMPVFLCSSTWKPDSPEGSMPEIR